jgi:hypothetical protein
MNAAIEVAVTPFIADRVAPMMTIDSPSAIRMNAWHRSAMWLPTIVQSAVRERPSHGVANPTMPPRMSTPTASSQSSSRRWPCASPPATASAPLTTHQTSIRSKLPDHRQQDRGLPGAADRRPAEQVVRQLRDREHVDQVEEQLDVGDPLVARAVAQQPAEQPAQQPAPGLLRDRRRRRHQA